MTPYQEMFFRSLELAIKIKGPINNAKNPSDAKSELEFYLPLAMAILEESTDTGRKLGEVIAAKRKAEPQTKKPSKKPSLQRLNSEAAKRGIGN